jgi:hypothetical protein
MKSVQKIITSSSAHGLNSRIKELMAEGWEPIGSHQVATIHQQPRYRGSQLGDVQYTIEYSQTMRWEPKL